MYNETIILGIETSCDETGVSIYNNKKGILSEYTYTQTVHYKYGGIIPELASRNHEKKLLNLVILTLKKARIKLSDINIIAYTGNPGLSSSLLFGITFSKSLSYSLNIPSIEINHLEAHILISFLFNKKITFPSLVVLISGAHTILVEIKNYNTFLLLGKTLDDGVGEAFDKAARSLNIKPCNGLSIEKISKLKFNFENLKFPQPLSKSNCFNLSFSGLKTCVNKNIKKNMLNLNKSNIAYNFQNTIIKTLLRKCKLILKKKKMKNILLSGGVASNKELRLSFLNMADSIKLKTYTIPTKYCTDNGTMIAFLGFLKSLENKFDKNLYLHIKLNKKNYLT